MATWAQTATDSLEAAKVLCDQSLWRSCVSRAYYAAYSSLTGRALERGVRFGRGWNNPPHEQLPRLVAGPLRLSIEQQRKVLRALRRLRMHREDADYRPAAFIDRSVALACVHDASMIVQTVEGPDER